MKFFTPTALLAAALVSVVAALPFMPASKIFTLQARLAASASGTLQVFYDDGTGIREELSSRVPVTASSTPRTYEFSIPPGRYYTLRLDPLERAQTITVSSLRVVSQAGRTVAEIPLGELKPGNQIQTFALANGALQITSEPASDDPQVGVIFSSPLVVQDSWRDYVRAAAPLVLPLFAAMALLLFAIERAHRWRGVMGNRMRAMTAHPQRAVSLVAALAVVASAYPIVFLGKSYVSPNLGTILLYDDFPTLPGYQSTEVVDVKLSDIGAVMWAHLPYSMIQHRALGHGELPLWNRYNSGGVPLLAQGQSMFGDPIHFLVIAANGAAWAWDLKYLIAKWLFATGLGLTVLTLVRDQAVKDQETKRPRDERTTVACQGLLVSSSLRPLAPWSFGPLAAALIVAAATPFIGFFLYRVNHPAFFSLCYAPWPLYCLIRVAQTTTRRAVTGWSAGLIVANLALMNSGTVKEAYMLLACVNFSGACVLLAVATSWRERLAKLAALAWAGLLFVLITAPIWATFLQTLKSAYTGYNAVSAFQIQPTLLLGAFDEIFYRPLMAKDQVFSPSLNFLLLLGVLYFLATLRLQFANRAVVALAASSLVPLSLAFGFISPQWIITLPFLSNIAHIDNTFSCVLIVLWSVLAGIGYATAAHRLGTREGRHDLIVAGLLLFALIFGWVAFRQASHRPILGPTFTVNQPGHTLAITPFIWSYLMTLVIASLVLAVAVHGAFVRGFISVPRGLIIAICALALVWRHGMHANGVRFPAFTTRPTERVDFHAQSPAMEYARAAQAREPGRGYGLHGNFFPGWTPVYGLEGIHGPDALVNPWMRELVGVSGVERMWDWRVFADTRTIANARPFFDALNVRYYFDRRSDQPALGQALKLLKVADLDVYESTTAWPRAYFINRVDVYDEPAELVTKIRTANGHPFAAVQRSDAVAQAAVAPLLTPAEARSVSPATGYTLTENTTSFHVHATGPGVVVLTEVMWKDDFKATVNGRRAPVIRLNHAFKGVVVPAAGDYRIAFEYWPKNFGRSLTMSGIGALLLLASVVAGTRTPRQLRRSAPALSAVPA